MYKNYLFDLDGTLLPLDEELFVKTYFSQLAKKFHELKLDPEKMIKKLWAGTNAMIMNDGSKTNETVFWDIFQPSDMNQDNLKQSLEQFYQNEFDSVKTSAKPSVYSKEIISLLRKRGKNIILATNPIFPQVATERRIKWAMLDKNDFHYITTYENSYFAKPSLSYFENILLKFNFLPEETIMIGNDALEDMVAKELGINTFLVTDCLNNKSGIDINQFEHGTLEELYQKIVKGLI
ncbi:MAG: HAD family hydrolase [Candidatus Izemoplasmatales bacterium]|jgi:FMN phosphatase YigB (HAD superfamily)|nr:HAD family hydrolase [Candidatus Izemoplasmatales bacterium]